MKNGFVALAPMLAYLIVAVFFAATLLFQSPAVQP